VESGNISVILRPSFVWCLRLFYLCICTSKASYYVPMQFNVKL